MLDIPLLKKAGSRFRTKKESFVESEFSSSHLGKEMPPDLKQICIQAVVAIYLRTRLLKSWPTPAVLDKGKPIELSKETMR